MIKTVSLDCPSCGAPIYPADGEREVLCSYCGTKVVVHDSTRIHIVDEADVIRAETEREEARHRIAMQKRSMGSRSRILSKAELSPENARIYSTLSVLKTVCIALTVLGFIMTGIFSGAQDDLWVGCFIAGVTGWTGFSKMRKKRFTEAFAAGIEALNPDERKQLSLYRTLEYASIGCTLLPLVLTGVLQNVSDALWTGLFLAGIVGWVVFSRKIKKLVRNS